MRRLILALSAVFLSMGLVLAVSIGAPEVPEAVSEEPAAGAQYLGEDYDAPESRPPEVQVPETGPGVSEGSAPEARAPAEAISAMEPAEPYWKDSPGRSPKNAKDYSYVQPAEDTDPARYRVKIPTTDQYTVYARWPAARANNAATRFGVRTPSGVRWTEANQRRDGGIWMRIGAYRMEVGNRYAVRISGRSKAEGRVVADAVMVVRGTQMTPPRAEAQRGEPIGAQGTGHDVVREARSHIGTPYRHSPPGPCQAHRSEDCSCLTSLVFDRIELPDNPVEQWNSGQNVARRDLRPGDLVFFKEGGSSVITHVAIYSGNGNIVHASSYWGRVVEREMRYVDGYFGAKRLTG